MKNHKNYLELIELLCDRAKMEKVMSADITPESESSKEDEELEKTSDFIPR